MISPHACGAESSDAENVSDADVLVSRLEQLSVGRPEKQCARAAGQVSLPNLRDGHLVAVHLHLLRRHCSGEGANDRLSLGSLAANARRVDALGVQGRIRRRGDFGPQKGICLVCELGDCVKLGSARTYIN